MSDFKKFVRTDIASEGISGECDKIKTTVFSENGFEVRQVTFLEKQGNFDAGNYFTLELGELWNKPQKEIFSAASAAVNILKKLTSPLVSGNFSVLVACLGNRRITSDAIGPLCAERLIVTRHIKNTAPELFCALGGRECSVICPGVTGDTGIETFDIIHSAVKAIKPSILICIDALASKSIDRLATTLQMSDVGMSPGSGIGNRRKEISCTTLGIPVISIGIPTVVRSSTLVIEALEKSGIKEISPDLQAVLENGTDYFVTLKDADIAVSCGANLIARALNEAFLGIPEL